MGPHVLPSGLRLRSRVRRQRLPAVPGRVHSCPSGSIVARPSPAANHQGLEDGAVVNWGLQDYQVL